MRRLVLLASLLTLAVSMVPMGAHATHCRDIFILSGDDSIREPYEESRVAGFNLGAATCTRSNTPDVPTNYFTPGATKAWGALGDTNTPVSGTIKGVAATFQHNALRSRWETQAVSIGTATSITLTVSYLDGTGASKSATITYTKAA